MSRFRYRYTAEVYDFAHDIYGNPTSHFTLWDHSGEFGRVMFKTSRRQQTGYCDSYAEHALCKLRDLTGRDSTPVILSGSRHDRIGLRVGFKLKPAKASKARKPAA